MSLYDNVYGITYREAETQINILEQALEQRDGKSFDKLEELEDWAKGHLLSKIVYSPSLKKFLYMSHRGELLLPSEFEAYYSSILRYKQISDGKVTTKPWIPDGFRFFKNAYIIGERSDGLHKPIYYRDYTVPSGYYSFERDAFNIAHPFKVFAKETGRDTSHIYIYLQHIAGECYMWLLAWLRAKLLYPCTKTQIMPIFVSKAQGSGKTTFAEVICKGLFGEENVLVSDQYDSSARFNADYADSLIVCLEEKEETDKRNSAGALKSRTTATTIRKELKGVDPIYQDSYTDFIMTTNKDVPIKFDGQEDQRRFMIMEADPTFTRKTSELADEVFTKLYGFDANMVKHGTPFTEDNDLIAQFKHELFTREDIAEVPLRNFPKTAAYNRCYSLPRTSESTEIEAIIKSIAPFIKASLEAGKIVDEVNNEKLTNIIQYKEALQYMPAYKDIKAHVALCRPLVFYEMGSMKPLPHANVERGLLDAASWLRDDYGINLISDMRPLIGGFTGVSGRYKQAPTARFTLVTDVDRPVYVPPVQVIKQPMQLKQERIGERFRVNNRFKPDANGCFETVNEMKPGTVDLKDKTKHVQYMDTFLLESDTATGLHKDIEKKRAAKLREEQEFFGVPIEAEELYKERLDVALKESQRLFNDGIVARIVYSGAKSYHLLVRVADAPTTIEEYTFLHSWLCCHISDKLEFDQSTSDPARLTRSPVECKRSSKNYDLLIEGTQKLIAEDWSHVYSIDWRPLYQQWLNKPKEDYERKNGRPMIPTRQIYRDAVKDIVSGAFWCDSKWNGQRQECFFPAYRILRLMGYSHADLWPNVMLKGIDRYSKQADIPYWKSRESCALIESIDNDVEAYDESYSVS